MASVDAPRLPAANEFTPGQLGGAQALYELLALIQEEGGVRKSIVERIRVRWFSEAAQDRLDLEQRLEQQRKRAQNVISGMRQYGLLSASPDPVIFTELASKILNSRGQPEFGYELFASFLLRERHGIELLEIAKVIFHRDGAVTKKAVDHELKLRGYLVPTNSSYSGKLRQWLEISGIVDGKWEIDDAMFTKLGGASSVDIVAWRSLSSEQRSTIEILLSRSEGDQTPIPSNELLDLLRNQGVEFDAGQVRKKIYDPLNTDGWITHQVASGGRGGKGGLISLTQKSYDLDVKLIEGLKLGDVPHELQEHLARPTHEIMNDLRAEDTGVKGTALELLSLRLASDLGLFPVDLRLRSSQTGGAEVDLVAEGAHLHFTRWLFQCKNQTSVVGLSVLAKELGMATLLRAQVIVIVTTSTFSGSVKEYARRAAETTSIQIVLLDQNSLQKYETQGSAGLRAELHSLALDTLTLKRPQVSEVPYDT